MLLYLTLLDSPKDRNRFCELYEKYKMKMYYVAFGILNNEQDAENIVHDTFVTIIDVLDKLDTSDQRKEWNYIVTILKNKCYNHLKRESRVQYFDDILEFERKAAVRLNETEKAVIEQETAKALAEIIRSMKYPYKEVIYLQYYNSLSSSEIAEILDIKPAYVCQISKRAKKHMQRQLQKMGFYNAE